MPGPSLLHRAGIVTALTACCLCAYTDAYSAPSGHVNVCGSVSSATNCANFLFCPSVGRTRLFCTMATLEPQMTGLLKMETYGE